MMEEPPEVERAAPAAVKAMGRLMLESCLNPRGLLHLAAPHPH
jgi:hypothetical protein